jgi:hypothetical protein
MGGELKPISPSDIIENLDKIIPPVVIQAVNNLLKKEFRGSSATILQDDIVSEIMRLDGSYTRDMIFDNKILDFEEIYRKNGWSVEYDKPGYCESYTAKFIFKKK